MRLIDLFEDYIRNKKDLIKYIEARKSIPTEGEFSDKELMLAAKKLQRLKEEDPKIYDGMHQTLEEYYRRDEGHFVEYPINFVQQVLKMYNNIDSEHIYECYKQGLEHPCGDRF